MYDFGLPLLLTLIHKQIEWSKGIVTYDYEHFSQTDICETLSFVNG